MLCREKDYNKTLKTITGKNEINASLILFPKIWVFVLQCKRTTQKALI